MDARSLAIADIGDDVLARVPVGISRGACRSNDLSIKTLRFEPFVEILNAIRIKLSWRVYRGYLNQVLSQGDQSSLYLLPVVGIWIGPFVRLLLFSLISCHGDRSGR